MSRCDLTREGEIGEMITQLDLTKQGYVVSTPITASTPGYDLICDKNGELKKIQVKSLKPSDKGKVTVPLVNRKNSSVQKNGRGQTHRYSELVDFIAVSIKGTDDVRYLPCGILNTTATSQTFRIADLDQYKKMP